MGGGVVGARRGDETGGAGAFELLGRRLGLEAAAQGLRGELPKRDQGSCSSSQRDSVTGASVSPGHSSSVPSTRAHPQSGQSMAIKSEPWMPRSAL